MMVALGFYVRRGQRLFRRWISDPQIHAIAQSIGYLMCGFLLSAASLSSLPQPLTLGLLCVQTGWPGVLLAAGGVGGYLFFWGSAGIQGVIWVAAGLLVSVLSAKFPDTGEKPLLLAALAGLITALSGLGFQLFLQDETPVPMYILRVALAAGSAWLYGAAMLRRDPVVDWLVAGTAVLALAQAVPIPYLGLGFIAAGVLASAGAFPGAAIGGLALDLAGVTPVPMTAVMSLAWLIRLIPGGNRYLLGCAPPMVYLVVMGLCGKWDMAPLAGLLLGGMGATLLPGRPSVARRRGETGFAQVRLEMAASVLNQTEQLLSDVEDPPIDEEAIIARAVERACSGCPCRKNCKESPGQIPASLLHRPLGNGGDLPVSCRKTGRLLMELRRGQEQFRAIRADRDRQEEYRASVVQQYRFLSEYLQELSDALSHRASPVQQWYQPELAVCSASREKANGDRCLWFAGPECRYYILLVDGMGTGEGAARDGRNAGEFLKKLLCAGYPASHALKTFNSFCALQGRAGAVTVDLAELRLDTGRATVYKWGAAPSYLVSRGETVKIGTAGPPPGLSVTDSQETTERLSLRRGETLVLLSDGAGGEEALRQAWGWSTEPPGELAARILEGSRQEGGDDATVAVVRLSALPVST